ncbi:Uma2 family endonuclease [soil metagenome]
MELTPWELAQYEEADEYGVVLETIAGQPFWEFQPNYDHQDRIFEITVSVRKDPGSDTDCGCFKAMDVGIQFPDDSIRRPDLSIFCREPERREIIRLIPEAVVEIVSQRSREKDLVTSPPWYLAMGVKDVLVYDPFTDDVHHFRRDGNRRFKPGKTVSLECGCLLDV